MPPHSRTVGRDSNLGDIFGDLDYMDMLARRGQRLSSNILDDLTARNRPRSSFESCTRLWPAPTDRRRSPISEGMRERTTSPEETPSNAATLRADVRRLTRKRDAARDERDAAREQRDDAGEGLSDIMDSVEQLGDDVLQLRRQTRSLRSQIRSLRSQTRSSMNASATTFDTESVNSNEVEPSRTRVHVSATQTPASSTSEDNEFSETG